jgi:hybrid cluster-associated redox disulfide protein
MTDKIKKENVIGEVIEKHPDLAPVFFKHGLHCVGCPAARGESIEAGAKAHGLDEEKITALIKELNQELEKK